MFSSPNTKVVTVRYFPSAVRSALPEWVAIALVVVVAAYGLAMPLANADDEKHLKREQRQVQQEIDAAESDLHEASKEVARATFRLDRAQAELSAARSTLERVRGRLSAARTEAVRLQRELTAAELRLDRAEEQLSLARAEVAAQRRSVRGTVLGIATDGNPALNLVSSYLSSGSVEEIMVNGVADEMVVGREEQALDALEAAEAALKEHKDEVEAARDDVEAKKRAADRNVRRVAGLFHEARDTKARVDHLLWKAKRAWRDAVTARKADRAALQRLEQREARIRNEILRLAQQNPGATYNGATGGLLHTPVSGPVTSPFGYRTHPIYGYYGLHDGTDFGAACGSALWAGAGGTVINEYYDEVYGNRLYLSIGQVNGANITLVYNHLTSFSVGEGARVGRGQVVGTVGSTGWSTGCHLHFTVLRDGKPVDPMGYL